MSCDGGASSHDSHSDRLCSEISAGMARLARDHLGRGPVSARTHTRDDLIVCVLSDELIPIERTMLESGARQQAVAIRREFQDVMKPRYASMVEQVTGAKVLAVFSDAEVEPDVVVIVFQLDRQLDQQVVHARRSAGTSSGRPAAGPRPGLQA